MTPTSIQDNGGFETPSLKKISREDLAELVNKLITSYLDSLRLLRARSAESEDAANVTAKLESFLYSNNLRELSETDIKTIGTDIKASTVLSWFFTRMLSSINATSIDNNVVDNFIASSMTFFPLSKMDNEYSAENSLSSESQIKAVYNKYPFIKVLVLFEILNITQEIEFSKTDPSATDDR